MLIWCRLQLFHYLWKEKWSLSNYVNHNNWVDSDYKNYQNLPSNPENFHYKNVDWQIYITLAWTLKGVLIYRVSYPFIIATTSSYPHNTDLCNWKYFYPLTIYYPLLCLLLGGHWWHNNSRKRLLADCLEFTLESGANGAK